MKKIIIHDEIFFWRTIYLALRAVCGTAVWVPLLVVAGSDHRSYITDVTQAQAVSQLFLKVKDDFQGHVPSIVVCCAGVLIVNRLEDTQECDFDNMIAVNLKVWCKQISRSLSHTYVADMIKNLSNTSKAQRDQS